MSRKPYILYIFVVFALLAAAYFAFGDSLVLGPLSGGDSEIENGAGTTNSTHETYQSSVFSFSYPKENTVSEFKEGEDGEIQTILVQKNGRGVQISVSAFDEDITITEARIKADIPDMIVKNSRPQSLGASASAQGLYFESIDDAGTPTREFWVIYNRELYQFRAYESEEKILKGIIESWKWN